MHLRPIIPLIALATLGGACGSSSDGAQQSTTTLAVTTTVAAEPAPESDVQFESEPIQAGPLFGSGAASAKDTDIDASSQPEPCDDCDPDEVPDRPAFQPASTDEPFCSLLADLEERPFPSDESESLVVARAWIAELRAVAPDSIGGDLDTFIQVLDTAIDSQGQIGIDQVGEELGEVSDRVDVDVDSRCHGRQTGETTITAPDGEQQPPAESVTIDGVVIGVVEFSGRAASESTPYFGDDLAVGSAGSQRPEADAFCRAINVINNRPQPTSDLEELRVGGAYFEAIAPLVPDDLVEEFAIIDAWIDTISAEGGFTDVNDPEDGDEIMVAVEAVNSWIGQRCAAV